MSILKTIALRRIPIFALLPLYTILLTTKSQAGCVASDVNVQYAIASPNSSPSAQTNNLDLQFEQNCLGNSSHGSNIQIYSGDNSVQQYRERNANLNSPENNGISSLTTPNIETNINQQLHLPILPQLSVPNQN